MARIKIHLPEGPALFSTFIDVRIDDINYGNHLGNDTILRYFHETRLRFLKSKDSSEMDILGHAVIMADTAISYKSESFHGDQLKVDLYCEDFHRYGFDFTYKITRGTHEIARGKTGMIFFDYRARKIKPAPDKIQNFFYPT